MSSSSIHRTPKSTTPTRPSLFFTDLSTPVSTRRSSKFTTPSHTHTHTFTSTDLPPPPVFTLEDRHDLSPESPLPAVSSPDHHTPIKSPNPNPNPSPGSSAAAGGKKWWSESGGDDKGRNLYSGSGSPVDGVVQREEGVLLTVPRPREVVRPEVKRSLVPVGAVDEEEWVTVYGFSLADTNLVLREFEKCGVILKHVLGPRDSNWMHILYQSRYDAQKALSKNAMQLNGALIVGVKPVDPIQRQALSDKMHNQGFVPMPPSTTTRKTDPIAFNASTRPQNQNGPTNTPHSGGTMASPAKSMVSKIADLMFGL